ncbi:alpha/beta hydrolase [Ureibacillus acetophenoni]|uniref:Acetyl esterase n=1 Tax=Ureibacillus acetophenoni TaxID=614649 RepID=A0A285U675_9BACL|nr:alpha/beta hydrolase fold domain-containing protein [Ureibacillus acetophenoni]SOC37332.1 acetyl esterase [Ureibacillus acetophenoni]
MPIHSYILKYFDEHTNERTDGIKQENPPQERRPTIHQIEDQIIKLNGYQLPIRIYTPTPQEHYSLLVFFHEGRFMNGNLEASDVACRMIASFSGHKLIAIDYPASLNSAVDTFDKCYEATKWISQQADTFNGKVSDISIAGGSIGGTIATLLSIEAIKRNDFTLQKQILFYPITDFNEQIEDSHFLSRKMYNGKYGIDINNLKGLMNSNLESPLNADEKILSNMPNTLIYTAEYDPFSDEAEEYAEKIQSAGGEVKLVRFDGNIHGFMQSFPGSPDYMRGFELTTEFLINEEKEVLT